MSELLTAPTFSMEHRGVLEFTISDMRQISSQYAERYVLAVQNAAELNGFQPVGEEEPLSEGYLHIPGMTTEAYFMKNDFKIVVGGQRVNPSVMYPAAWDRDVEIMYVPAVVHRSNDYDIIVVRTKNQDMDLG